MPTPVAVLQYRINGGPLTSGPSTVNAGDVVTFFGSSYVGWTAPAARWEIRSYPPGWSIPAGWTYDAATGYLYYLSTNSSITPPSITMPNSGQVAAGLWGKWIFALTVNGDAINLFDNASGVKILSSTGLEDLGTNEGGQFGGLSSWALGIQKNNRIIAAAIAGGMGGGVSLGSGTPANATAAAGSAGALTTAAPFDHSHQVATAIPVAVGTSLATGSSTSLARADHVHTVPFAVVAAALAAATTSLNLNGQKITNSGTPSPASTDLATTAYVDAASGAGVAKAVRGASLATQSLSGTLTEDGVTYANGDRYLAKNQSTASQNGIYVVNTAGAWTRSGDFASSGQAVPGMVVMVSEGTANGATGWELITPAPITLGTTALTFAEAVAPVAYAPTASTVALRGTSGDVIAAWFAPTTGAVASAGVLRLPVGDGTVIAIKGASHTSVPLIATASSGAQLILGDGVEIVSISFQSAYMSHMGPASFDSGTAASISQAQLGSTGASPGGGLSIQAQQGQDVASGTNNNGGALTLAGGLPGAGGSGGVQGSVAVQGGGLTVTVSAAGIDFGAGLLADIGTSITFNNAVTPTLTQATLAGTGATAGVTMTVQSQAGQAVASGTNNTGGALHLYGGAAGTGGTGGVQGSVVLGGGGVFLTVSANGTDFGAAPIVDVGSSFSFAAAVTPTITQANPTGTGTNVGQTMLIQAQQGQDSGTTSENVGGELHLFGGNEGPTTGIGNIHNQGNVVVKGGGVSGTFGRAGLAIPTLALGAAAPTSTTNLQLALDLSSSSPTGLIAGFNGSTLLGTILAWDGNVNNDIILNPSNTFGLRMSGAAGNYISLDVAAIGGGIELAVGSTKFDMNGGVTFDFHGGPVELHDSYLDLLAPIAAPGSPASGFRLFVDVADGKLKAKASTGTITNLASP